MNNDPCVVESYTVNQEHDRMRLDIFLSTNVHKTRSYIQKLIAGGRVQINGKNPKKSGDLVKVGDSISILEEGEKIDTTGILPKVAVVRESPDFLVIDKPAGVLVHRTMAKEEGTVVDWLEKYYPNVVGVGENPVRPGIVHRLDREASGLLVIARTQRMFAHLKEQFKQRTVEKEYSVLVHGVISSDHDMIDFDIDRGKDGKMVSRPHTDVLKVKNIGKEQQGKEARTEFWVEKRYARYTLLRVRIHTGRMHQIRVHFYAYGCPVVGDQLYTNPKLIKRRDREFTRLFLHAYRLTFIDVSGQRVENTCPLPSQLTAFLETLS